MGIFFRNKSKKGAKSPGPSPAAHPAPAPQKSVVTEQGPDAKALFLKGLREDLNRTGDFAPDQVNAHYKEARNLLQEKEDTAALLWLTRFLDTLALPGNHAFRSLPPGQRLLRKTAFAALAAGMDGFGETVPEWDGRAFPLSGLDFGECFLASALGGAEESTLLTLLGDFFTSEEEPSLPDPADPGYDLLLLLRGWQRGSQKDLEDAMRCGSTAALWKLCLMVKTEDPLRYWPEIRDLYLASDTAFASLNQKMFFLFQGVPRYANAIYRELETIYGTDRVNTEKKRLGFLLRSIEKYQDPLPGSSDGESARPLPVQTETASAIPWQTLFLAALRCDLGLTPGQAPEDAAVLYRQASRAAEDAPVKQQEWLDRFLQMYQLPAGNAFLSLSPEILRLRKVGFAAFASYRNLENYRKYTDDPEGYNLLTAREWIDLFQQVRSSSTLLDVNRNPLIEMFGAETARRQSRTLRNYDHVIQDIHEEFRRDADRASEAEFDKELLTHDFRLLLRGWLLLGSSASLYDAELLLDLCDGRHPFLVGCDYLEKGVLYGSTASLWQLLRQISRDEELSGLVRKDRILPEEEDLAFRLYWDRIRDFYLPSETAFDSLKEKLMMGFLYCTDHIDEYVRELVTLYGEQAVRRADTLGFLR